MNYSQRIKDDVFHIIQLSGHKLVTRGKVNYMLTDSIEGEYCDAWENYIRSAAIALESMADRNLTNVDEGLITAINNLFVGEFQVCGDALRHYETIVVDDVKREPISLADFKTHLILLNGIANDLDRTLAICSYLLITHPFQYASTETTLCLLTIMLSNMSNGSIIDLGQQHDAFQAKLKECHKMNDTVPMYTFLKSIYAHLSIK